MAFADNPINCTRTCPSRPRLVFPRLDYVFCHSGYHSQSEARDEDVEDAGNTRQAQRVGGVGGGWREGAPTLALVNPPGGLESLQGSVFLVLQDLQSYILPRIQLLSMSEEESGMISITLFSVNRFFAIFFTINAIWVTLILHDNIFFQSQKV